MKSVAQTIKKLQVVESVTAYCHNNWDKYKDILLPIRKMVIDGLIEPKNVRYVNQSRETYYPITKEKSWGSNLDNFSFRINKDNSILLTYSKVNQFESYDDGFKFSFEFNLTNKQIAEFFANTIDIEFDYHAESIFEEQERQRIKLAILNIKQNLLK